MNKIPYDITFHPTWWHENAGIDFSQPFFDDYRVRMESDVKMRRTLYEHFGAYGIGEKDPQPRRIAEYFEQFRKIAQLCLVSAADKMLRNTGFFHCHLNFLLIP